nr:MAG TPA: hypothetical protein [Caudoviricetes sp.]
MSSSFAHFVHIITLSKDFVINICSYLILMI